MARVNEKARFVYRLLEKGGNKRKLEKTSMGDLEEALVKWLDVTGNHLHTRRLIGHLFRECAAVRAVKSLGYVSRIEGDLGDNFRLVVISEPDLRGGRLIAQIRHVPKGWQHREVTMNPGDRQISMYFGRKGRRLLGATAAAKYALIDEGGGIPIRLPNSGGGLLRSIGKTDRLLAEKYARLVTRMDRKALWQRQRVG